MAEEKKASACKVTAIAIWVILGWGTTVFMAFITAAPIAILGGMEPGGWNLHLIYPCIFSGLVALIVYPMTYAAIFAKTKNAGAALGAAIALAISLGSIVAFLAGRSA